MEHARTTGKDVATTFTNHIEVEGDLSPRERAILLNSARHCDVHKLIGNEIHTRHELIIRNERAGVPPLSQ